jgi:hypothetical protein
MDRIEAVIEAAEVRKVGDIFRKKPGGLRFNETEALIVKARTRDGRQVGATFYFSLKPDGTFEDHPLGADAAKARRRRLASFLRYYRIAEDVSEYKLKERVNEWKGRIVEAVPSDGELALYYP